ncbi:hypothetical protein [Chitinophaga barathri]|uniref:Uncharacterized protein n=1 Tax=Chitinophaga barathri TaxID=1647451 RepID=A0A3N4MH88_9BACT|nr:hypothetical protein [Chitinophaga barathri]RPD42795.1 hypothetical protein EG028_00410 [Chitinophaga barathri]
MLILQLLILVIAWASAIFGIWSKDGINKKVAWTATVITSFGLVAGSTMAVIESGRKKDAAAKATAHQEVLNERLKGLSNESAAQKQRAETLLQQLRLALTGTALSTLEIRWEFDSVPGHVLDIFSIGDAMEHAGRLSDDEIDRLDETTLSRLRQAWYIENVLEPMMGILSTGNTDLNKLFSGDVAKAIAAFSGGVPSGNPDDNWFQVSYDGSRFHTVFPLNVQYTSALGLGKTEDDPAWALDEEVEGGLAGYLHQKLNYGFYAGIQENKTGFVFTWKYDMKSLERASMGNKNNTAAFPVQFHFMSLVNPASKDYIDILRQQPFDSPSADKPQAENWMVHSRMILIPNEIEEAAVVYNVERMGIYDRMVEYSKYDHPEKLFEYTLFKAKMKQ